MSTKYVYAFSEGDATMKNLLGGKGANLAEMTKIGLKVPTGFTVTTESCNLYQDNNCQYPEGLWAQLKDAMLETEKLTGKGFGDAENPLLMSVRSGARVSMPGMMDTILNLGLNQETVEGLAVKSGDRRFALDCYRRLIQMYGDVVLDVSMKNFEHALEAKKTQKGVELDTDLDEAALDELVNEFLGIVKEKTGNDFPADPDTQLDMAIKSVFDSWNNKRARIYRKLNNIPHDIGTAVNVQVMVFGNIGHDSGTGVAFTRNPATGEKEYYGEYLMDAQGEDVVAGIRTPKPVTEMAQEMPSQYEELKKVYGILENHYKDIQDFEFTIEEGTLYLLQTRNGKRTAQAAVKAAVDMMKEGYITKEEAIMRVDPNQLDQLLHPVFDPSAEKQVIAKGLNASPGAATGKVVFDSDKAVEMVENGEAVILVRTETSPEDIHGMFVSEGILTARGGMTSHAAVVARGMGKSCVAGCDAIHVDEKECKFTVGDITVKEGDWLSIDGSIGEVILGQVPTKEAAIGADFKELMSWADEIRTLHVKTNAEVPRDVQVAKDFGAEGIGLARTEHMFFGDDRLPWIQRMVLATDETERKAALDKLLPMQRHDFEEVFTIMDKLPVIIRLLDPPLHEFLPKEDEDIQALSQTLGISAEEIKKTAESLAEFNPMLGFRGCRLGIIYPEINAMQARAIFEAGMNVQAKGINPIIQIEVPLVGKIDEFILIRKIIDGVAQEMGIKDKLPYQVGTMIEVPRAALTADEIAREADFLSFGTNDLTQMTSGFSRDDAVKFLGAYVDKNIYSKNPFETIDQEGVGLLMKICVDKARQVKPDIEIGICGEHGGEPESVKFCHRIGLDDVSCSPFRVPVARLAAAHAVIEGKSK